MVEAHAMGNARAAVVSDQVEPLMAELLHQFDHVFSHRVMAEDMIELMEQLGHQRFYLIGHDRGARVSHRMSLDHPERLMKLCLLDMLPTYYVWTTTTREWALGTWHWAFLAQPEPFPQTMIDAVTPEWFLTNRGAIPRQRPKIVLDEFIRAFTPKTVSGCCRDYRAGATINFEMDAADKDKQITTPLLVLWGTRSEEHTSELQSPCNLVCRLLLEKKK